MIDHTVVKKDIFFQHIKREFMKIKEINMVTLICMLNLALSVHAAQVEENIPVPVADIAQQQEHVALAEDLEADDDLPPMEELDEIIKLREKTAEQLLGYLFQAFADNPRARSTIRRSIVATVQKKDQSAHTILKKLHKGDLQEAMYSVQLYEQKRSGKEPDVTINDIISLSLDNQNAITLLVSSDEYFFLENGANQQTEMIAQRIPARKSAANQLMGPLFTATYNNSAVNRNIRKMMKEAANDINGGLHVLTLLQFLNNGELPAALDYARETHGGSHALLGLSDFSFDQFKENQYQLILSLVVASRDANFLDDLDQKKVESLINTVETMVEKEPGAIVLQLQLIQQRKEVGEKIIAASHKRGVHIRHRTHAAYEEFMEQERKVRDLERKVRDQEEMTRALKEKQREIREIEDNIEQKARDTQQNLTPEQQ